ncbi:ER membrane protein complex subunit 8/9, partial [Arabidopsis thaliana x Arabidopsis arenosa]
LSIVGYFHANERFDDVELCGVAKNIGDHISRYFPQAPILLVSKCLILCLWNALARQEAKGCEYPVFRASLRLMLRSPKRNIVVQYSAGFRIRKWDSKHLLLIVKNHLEAKENLKYGRHRYKLTSVEKPSTKSIKMKQRWKETAFSISCLF